MPALIKMRNIPNHDLLELITDSQSLESLADYFPVIERECLSGALARVKDGDYVEVHVCHGQAPYSLDALYERIV